MEKKGTEKVHTGHEMVKPHQRMFLIPTLTLLPTIPRRRLRLLFLNVPHQFLPPLPVLANLDPIPIQIQRLRKLRERHARVCRDLRDLDGR